MPASTHRYAVVLACDEVYAPYAFFVADQIAKLHPNRAFDICVAMQEPVESTAEHVRVVKIDIENPFDSGSNVNPNGTAVYLRLLLPALLADDYDRILYLDSDVFITAGDLDQLFQMDLGPHLLGAVRDNYQWRTPTRHVPEYKAVGIGPSPYFNSGVLLIDTARYLSERVLERCLELREKYPEALTRRDQSALNIVLCNDWAELSPVWNWQYTWSSRFFADVAEPVILHFIGPKKPWWDDTPVLPTRYRRPYAQFLRKTYPDRPDLHISNATKPATFNRVGRALVKHWRSLERMRRYLERFPEQDKPSLM